MENPIGCSQIQRIGNPTNMETSKCWMPTDVDHPMRERWIGWHYMKPKHD
jgi:hypothetical protein